MNKKTLSTVVGAAFATSLAGTVAAGENPFAVKDLASGYLHVAEAGKAAPEMKCGSGQCGGAMTKSQGMNCGGMKAEAEKKAEEAKKATEMKCAGMKMDAPAAPAAPAAPKSP
jgi:uncharacterized low-complexity protein